MEMDVVIRGFEKEMEGLRSWDVSWDVFVERVFDVFFFVGLPTFFLDN